MFSAKNRPAIVTAKTQVKKVVSTSAKSVSPRPQNSPRPSSAQTSKSNGYLKSKPSSRLSSPASYSVKPPPNAPRANTLKRKAPQPAVQFDTDSESDDSGVDSVLHAYKKIKQDSKSPHPSIGPSRKTFKNESWTAEDENKYPLTHGADIANAEMKGYAPAFEDEQRHVVKLRYPSNCSRERFEMVKPKTNDENDYSPLDDIINTIEQICQWYFPERMGEKMLDDITGFVRRLKRAVRDKSFDTYSSVINEFNDTVKTALADGTIANQVDELSRLPLKFIQFFMLQSYSRTISPHVELLKKYNNGTSNVYGEIMPNFASRIFEECNLTADQVFVDMGSGVGSVVLQAAFEIGCESWGIEVMPNPADLGDKLLEEFNARCKRWSIVPGKATLIKGDFLASEVLDEALRRADVVLINNKAFLPELNNSVLMKMLDLKEGCKVVSLKSFVPSDWRIRERTVNDPRNLLRVEEKEYYTGSVSWADNGGAYYIATKDSSMLRKFKKKMRNDG